MVQPPPLHDKPTINPDGTVTFSNAWLVWFGQVQEDINNTNSNYLDALPEHDHRSVTEGGFLYLDAIAISADTTLDSSYHGRIVECSGTITVTLPLLNDVDEGWYVWLKHIGAGTVTVATAGGNTIAGSSTFVSTNVGDVGLMAKGTSGSDWIPLSWNTGSTIVFSVASVSTNTTLDASYNGKLTECSGTITVTLPALSSVPTGWHVWLKHTGAGTVTVQRSGSDVIDNGTTSFVSANVNDVALLVKGGSSSAWRVLTWEILGSAVSDASASSVSVTSGSLSTISVTPTNTSPWGFSSEAEMNYLITGFNSELQPLINELKDDVNQLVTDVNSIRSTLNTLLSSLRTVNIIKT